MSDINAHSISGRVGKDAVLKWLPSQTAVLNFSVANSTGWGDKKVTTWYSVGIFGKFGESLEPYIKKGVKVFLTGESWLNKWTDNDGGEHQVLQFKATGCDVAGEQGQGQQQSGQGGFRDQQQKVQGSSRPEPAYGGTAKGGPAKQSDFADDDIPF